MGSIVLNRAVSNSDKPPSTPTQSAPLAISKKRSLFTQVRIKNTIKKQ